MKRTLFSISVFLISIWYYRSGEPLILLHFDEFEYRNVGPSRGGRVTAVAGIEAIHLLTIWEQQEEVYGKQLIME